MVAHRKPPHKSTSTGQLFLNGSPANLRTFRRISAYVEQEDALVGSLTVRETLDFAMRLSLPSSLKASVRKQHVEYLLKSFGLDGQADDLIGTPVRKGISGGQKRRVSIASQLITGPKILFLDEPTSGLDSAAAFEVVSFLKDVAQRHGVSIHLVDTVLTAVLIVYSADRRRFHAPALHVHVRHV